MNIARRRYVALLEQHVNEQAEALAAANKTIAHLKGELAKSEEPATVYATVTDGKEVLYSGHDESEAIHAARTRRQTLGDHSTIENSRWSTRGSGSGRVAVRR